MVEIIMRGIIAMIEILHRLKCRATKDVIVIHIVSIAIIISTITNKSNKFT